MPAFAPRRTNEDARERPTLLLVAISARALAQAARRAGYAAIAIDAFGDEDARAACREMWVVENAMGGFARVDLEPVVARACAVYAPAGIVFGSGFDDCPHKLDRLAHYAAVMGSPQGLAAAKDPRRFAQACEDAGIRHPPIRATAPEDPAAWLVKRRGGSGGLHIGPAGRLLAWDEYCQRQIVGRAFSLLFVRDPETLTPIAWSEQWTAPAPEAPFRYGGAAGPIALSPPDGLLETLAALTAALGVRGLASADFIDDGETFWLLEINARPGATLDVFDDDEDPLLARHIAALAGASAAPLKARAPAAAEIVYAETDATAPDAEWPEWTADRPRAGAAISAGAPLCSVIARAETAGDAKLLAQRRSARIQAWLREGGR